MKKFILICGFLLALSAGAHAQKIAVKTNAVGWAMLGTINAGAEVALSPRFTLGVDYGINPWEWRSNRQSEYWMVQPELRFWTKEKFNGHFIGLHYGYADFNYGMSKYRYDGTQNSVGLSYGYALQLCGRWRVEANFGLGYISREYDKYGRVSYPGSQDLYESEDKDLFGITRAGLSLIFIIK